uniref:Uncharacterized protein n=1 Tax=Grammatophora oceanica TaxID=210454 RepID=A0A7S1VEU0_9STRA|mmetsp:Transcript_44696/g.66345  ORF Transcript_44696/g.66345 Transcript_44696/m.66345 type:complete len:125 (+) Transcript_44696:1095-1469(+)
MSYPEDDANMGSTIAAVSTILLLQIVTDLTPHIEPHPSTAKMNLLLFTMDKSPHPTRQVHMMDLEMDNHDRATALSTNKFLRAAHIVQPIAEMPTVGCGTAKPTLMLRDKMQHNKIHQNKAENV